MLNESQLNVYVLDSNLSPHQKERLQAQVLTALRSLPPWIFGLLTNRLEATGAKNLPLIVEARSPDDPSTKIISFGEIEGRPSARLMPRLTNDGIDWEHDPKLLIAKAAAYMAAPPTGDAFWQRWSDAVATDRLRETDAVAAAEWKDASDLDLFLEMCSVYVNRPDHERWGGFPASHAFFGRWRDSA